jgi:hypothetical protein
VKETEVIFCMDVDYRDNYTVSVTRGRSSKPLFVTSEGISDKIAAGSIKSMHGDSRLPAHGVLLQGRGVVL